MTHPSFPIKDEGSIRAARHLMHGFPPPPPGEHSFTFKEDDTDTDTDTVPKGMWRFNVKMPAEGYVALLRDVIGYDSTPGPGYQPIDIPEERVEQFIRLMSSDEELGKCFGQHIVSQPNKA